ncbi:MAG: FAD-dependent oxidoreductase [Ruthenibacterium lactatiformans]
MVPAGQLFYPERCDGESRRAGHRAGCRRQDRAASTGERLAYDRLLAATGSRPFVPPIPGLETVERTFCFQTLSDASALAEALRPESRVRVILARGPHGRQMRRGIRGLCAQIAIADLAPRVLPAVLDDTAAAMAGPYGGEGRPFLPERQRGRIPGKHGPAQSGTELEFDCW